MLLLDELDTPSGCGDLYTARQQSTGATAGGGKGGCQATVEAAAASLCRLQTAAAGMTVICAAAASHRITVCDNWFAASAIYAAAVSYALGTSNAGSLANLLSASPAKHSTFMSAMSSARVQPAVNNAMDASACLAAFARRKAE